jgi:hypothetical protein
VSVTVYPNPAQDLLAVIKPENSSDYGIEIIDEIGQTLIKGNLNQRSNVVDIRNIPCGVYILVLTHGSGTKRERLIVQR